MQRLYLLSSPSSSSPSFPSNPNPNFSLFFSSQNLTNFPPLLPFAPRCSSSSAAAAAAVAAASPKDRRPPLSPPPPPLSRDVSPEERLPVVRRPAMDVSSANDDRSNSAAVIDAGLAEFAKKLPMFEPGERVVGSQEKPPLAVNLDLALYKAKILARNFRFQEAEDILKKVHFLLQFSP